MKKRDLRKEDEFIKEKLDIVCDTSGFEYEPPNRSEKNHQIVERFALSVKKQDGSTKTGIAGKKKVFLGIAFGAFSFLLVLSIVLVVLLKPNNEDFYYNDEGLSSRQYSLVEFQESFDVLFFDMSNASNLTIVIFRDRKSDVQVYAKIFFDYNTDHQVEFVIVFVDNYNFVSESTYGFLTQEGQTNIFHYIYESYEGNKVSFAKFIYNDYRYYICINSEEPENILNLLETFS